MTGLPSSAPFSLRPLTRFFREHKAKTRPEAGSNFSHRKKSGVDSPQDLPADSGLFHPAPFFSPSFPLSSSCKNGRLRKGKRRSTLQRRPVVVQECPWGRSSHVSSSVATRDSFLPSLSSGEGGLYGRRPEREERLLDHLFSETTMFGLLSPPPPHPTLLFLSSSYLLETLEGRMSEE